MEWVEANPGAPAAVKQAVLGKKLLEGVGMTREAVVASWGEPHERLTLGGGDSRWVYRKRQLRGTRNWVITYTLIFKGGFLMRVLTEEAR